MTALLLQWPPPILVAFLLVFWSVCGLAVRTALAPPLPSEAFRPQPNLTPMGRRILSDRLTPPRSQMDPRARVARHLSDAQTMGALPLPPSPPSVPLPLERWLSTDSPRSPHDTGPH